MKKLRELLIVVLIIGCAVVYVGNGPPRFWRDFSGLTESQVRDRLGEPFRDSRDATDVEDDSYTLGWYQGFEVGLFIEFQDGVVVAQKRYSR